MLSEAGKHLIASNHLPRQGTNKPRVDVNPFLVQDTLELPFVGGYLRVQRGGIYLRVQGKGQTHVEATIIDKIR